MNPLVVKPVTVVAATAIAELAAITLDLNTIILGVIGLIGSYLTMRMAALAAAAKEQKAAQEVAAKSMNEIHTAVNSGKTVMDNKFDDLVRKHVEQAKIIATLEEKLRGVDLAKAVASAQPGMVVLPAVPASSVPVMIQATPVPAPVATPVPTQTIAAIASAVEVSASAPSRIGEAITELKAAAEETSVAADKTVDLVDKQAK